jgi:16S rRNA (cytosine1402-N4)-methyltransferase
MQGYHDPVLLREVIKALNVKKGSWYIDATLGDGGHSLEILKLGGKVLGIDADPVALERAGKRFKDEGISEDQFRLVHGNFRDIKNLIQTETEFEGVLFDLGVSSLQLMDPERGFSFLRNGPLDMRMNPSLPRSALDLVNNLKKEELNELFTKLGEDRLSKRFAEAVVRARSVGPIKTTGQLAWLLEKEAGGKKGRIHPATQAFQALRIAVNDELNAISEALEEAREIIKGNILVISFHSLEDRIAKFKFADWQDLGFGKVLTKQPIVPSMDEVERNPRSRSAKLRVFAV